MDVVKDLDGEMKDYTPESKACFGMRCQFAECYGPLTGFHFTDKVRETVRQKLTSTIFKVHCGGYGDHGHQYHCDNWIEVKLIVKYQKNTLSILTYQWRAVKRAVQT